MYKKIRAAENRRGKTHPLILVSGFVAFPLHNATKPHIATGFVLYSPERIHTSNTTLLIPKNNKNNLGGQPLGHQTTRRGWRRGRLSRDFPAQRVRAGPHPFHLPRPHLDTIMRIALVHDRIQHALTDSHRILAGDVP